ncbi:integrase (plasmid) [Piscirickettsia salmonis]|uniref:Integrase n=1 Tax=Piscirickettsia salmonis TaxID=1238 RepID=A0AAC8VLS0_PISSA|nr:integrase [Piscirickettsia salmonis]
MGLNKQAKILSERQRKNGAKLTTINHLPNPQHCDVPALYQSRLRAKEIAALTGRCY